MSQGSLSARIAAAAREMQADTGSGDTLGRAIDLALQLVGSAQEAALSLVHRNERIETPAATSDLARRADELQYELKEGPCLDAIHHQEVVDSPDITRDERWPTWGPTAAEMTGIRSMMCFRLFTHEKTLGALNLYSWQTDAFDDRDRDEGLAIAAQAAVAVAASREIQQLRLAMDSRNLIGQAQGIIMARYEVDADAAFAVLARLSSHGNRKLRDVAGEVVKLRQLPDDTAVDRADLKPPHA